ncbi:MAG: thioredoxin-like domain-containing protein [Bacteroidales bacterium]|nr:thioredoxin-like domain-containing protein [Bacteroidales bacterium]
MKAQHVIVAIQLFVVGNLFSQKIATQIDFEIKGIENSFVVFGVEYLDKQIIIDTIRLNEQGTGAYVSKARLKPGVYVVTFPNKKYFELLIDDEQFLSITTDTSAILKKLSIVGATQPSLFIKHQMLRMEFEKLKQSNDSLKIAQLQIEMEAFIDSVNKFLPTSLLSAYFKLLGLNRRTNHMPKEVSSKTFINLQQAAEKHFIANFPFSDNRLIQSRLLFEQLNYYFNVFISQHPDTLISRISLFLDKARSNEEMYKYLLSFFNQNYRHCRTPAYEKVYVYLAEKYYLNGNAPWADKRFINQLEKKISLIKSSTIGSRASDLLLFSPNEKAFRLDEISAQKIILFFWDPECDICQSKYQELVRLVKSLKSRDLVVVAIYVHSNKAPWIEYIKKFDSPFIHGYDPLKKSNIRSRYFFENVPYFYLLDKNKVIVSKGTSLDRIWKDSN